MSDIQFEASRVRRSFDRAANTYAAAAVLQREVAGRLLEGLDFVRLSPGFILDAGCGTGEAWSSLRRRYPVAQVVEMDISENMLAQARRQRNWLRRPDCVCGTLDALPFLDDSFDLVYSSLSLQWCNDLSRVFAEVRRVLKPGGLFMFTSFGPDTLMELRACWAEVDDAVHVNHFVDMHDVGDELLRAGYDGPVMHAERMTLEYAEPAGLLQDLRDIGANITASGHRRGLMTRASLDRLGQAYERYRSNGMLPATYEVIYGHAWKPAFDPGSGEVAVRFTP